MSHLLSQLNPQQLKAATSLQGPIMILAGAGTGKTKVITSRIAYLLERGVPASEIAAMTFTNKAANEMKSRLAALAGEKAVRGISLGTFHGFCLKLLRIYHQEASLSSQFGIASAHDQQDLVKRALVELGWNQIYRADEILSQISLCKNHNLSPDDLLISPQARLISDPKVVCEIYRLYERQLKLNRVIDFDDCIFKLVSLFKTRFDLLEKINHQYRYILVDEFQDTNSSQFSVLQGLTKIHQNVCVVGDDDQSIYSWRGSNYAIFEAFEKHYPGTMIIKLEQNYRCSNVILDAANHLIKNNSQRKSKTLWSTSPVREPITVRTCEDAQAESFFVAHKALALTAEEFRPHDIIILYRTNTQAKAFEMSFREVNLPYKTFGGQGFFERKEVKDFCSYMMLIMNFNDHLALWRIINTPHRGIGLKTQEKIESLAHLKGASPFHVLIDAGLRRECIKSEKSQASLSHFVHSIVELANKKPKTPEELISLGDSIIERFGLVAYLKETVSDALTRQKKIEHLKSLPEWLAGAFRKYLTYQELGSIEEFIQNLLVQDSSPDEIQGAISLMSIHAAKGLEFPVVFVCGLEEGFMPHKHSVSNEALCEERRLFYVALTRAKTHLFLSWAKTRKTAFQTEERKPSRFLKELPNDIFQAPHVPSAEQRKEGTLKKISEIKSLLGQLK